MSSKKAGVRRRRPHSADLKARVVLEAIEPRRRLIDSDAKLSLSKPCELPGVGRSGWYYRPRGESAENLALMRALDELYTRWPFYGVRRMTIALQAQGWAVNSKRTRRLMRLMGLEAIYPKPRLSGNGSAHPRLPYLLKGLAIEQSNQVWCSDITYTGLTGGCVYRFALMDWFSHFVPAREPSNSLESDFCVRAHQRASRCVSSESLEIYQHLSLEAVEPAYQEALQRVSI